MLRFVRLTHGGIEILLTTFQMDCADLHQISEVVSSGGAPTPAGTSVLTKHNWDVGMGYLWLNGEAFIT